MSEENTTPGGESTATDNLTITDNVNIATDEANTSEGAPAAETAEELQAKKDAGEALTKKEEKVLKEYKLKVNGKERTIKFDPSNDAEVIKYLQKAESSDEKFKESAEIRKAAMQFIDELRKNPRKVLSDPNIGVDLKKFAEEIMNDQIAEMEKTPEQREREAMQSELEKLKKESKDREEALKKSEFERLQAQQEQELTTQIEAALDVGGIPKHPRTVKAMAEMMIIALENNIDLSPQDIAPIIKNNTMSEFKDIMSALSDDQLEDYLGKEILGRLTKKRVAKAPTKLPNTDLKATDNKPREVTKEVKKQTIRDFLKV
jgi:hypothetical protein